MRKSTKNQQGRSHFFTDAQGLKLAYENHDGIYQNGSILYIAGTKSGRHVYDDLKLPLYKTQQTKRYEDVDKFIKDGTIEVDGKKLTGITNKQIMIMEIYLEVAVMGLLLYQDNDQRHGDKFKNKKSRRCCQYVL